MFLKFILFYLPIISYAYNWYATNNNIYLNDQIVKIKGINWYGFETGIKCIEGLWDYPISFYLNQLNINNFNAIRIPISTQMILYDNSIIKYDLVKSEPLAYNKTSLQLLDIIFEESKKYNFLILLDIHRLKYGISTPLWYIPNNLNYTYDSTIWVIDYLIERYKNYPNFLGIDLYNEPHYMADYGSNNYDTDWKLFIEKCANSIFPKYPNYSFLFFINGVDWGKNLTSFGSNPPFLPQEYLNRIIISPHIYGPTLTYVPAYDKNVLYPLWDNLFGYLKYDNKWCICIGEWGGKFNYKKERLWLQIFSDYLIERDFTNNFYWALNPYSMDVTGLMKNWTVFSQEKLDFLQNVQKYPTHFFISDNSISIV